MYYARALQKKKKIEIIGEEKNLDQRIKDTVQSQ